MPRICHTCLHPDRESIDRALVSGESMRPLSALYRVSEDALARHKEKHLSTAMLKGKAAKEETHADDLLSKVRTLEGHANRIAVKAEAAGDFRAALQGIRELTRIVELLAKLLGELDERSLEVNILVAPEWLQVRTVLMDALTPYPEARTAVASKLLTLEASE